MTPVETLREAARLMRERAEAATPGPWEFDVHAGHDGCVVMAHGWRHAHVPGDFRYARPRENADHIASWHPAVALAVADWLDNEAEVAKRADTEMPSMTEGWMKDALAVARAYLGETP